MKIVTVRDLSRNPARILDAVENGESFELRRNGRAVAYMSRQIPESQAAADWQSHFRWLRKQPRSDQALLREFEAERRRNRARDHALAALANPEKPPRGRR